MKVMLLDNNEPTSYGEAMVGPDSDEWLEAIKSERGSMYENKVWTLEELLDGHKTIKYRWFFRRKTNDDGESHHLESSTCCKEVSDKFKELTTMRLSHP